MNDDKYLAAAIRVALKKGMICQSMEVDKKKSFRDGKSINGDICLFNRSGKEIGIIDRESIEKNEISFAKEEKENQLRIIRQKEQRQESLKNLSKYSDNYSRAAEPKEEKEREELRQGAIKWAKSMGYPVPTKWDGCLTTFLIVIGVCAYVVPGLLILLFVWYNGNQYERDMKALVAKWIDAGKPKPGEKVKPIEKLEKVEGKPVELPSTKEPSTESRLEELLSMKEKGLISPEEYDILRKKALGL